MAFLIALGDGGEGLGLPPDPRTTPFVERLEDVRRIDLALPEPLNVAYAIGELAGLRTGEVFALRWQHVLGRPWAAASNSRPVGARPQGEKAGVAL